MRNAEISRKTAETDVQILLEIDGRGESDVDTGVPFLDHMLTLFSKHGLFDLTVRCVGDVAVDYHHSVEDIGIALGSAFAQALGGKERITRFASAIVPMDEALVLTALDISGRPFLSYDVEFIAMQTGNFDAQLLEEFMRAFSFNAGITLHIKKLVGVNTHHIIEGAFKSLAVALDEATREDPRKEGVPSTKGVL